MLAIDEDFAARVGVGEAIYMAILRHNEVTHALPIMNTHSNIGRAYPLYCRNKYRDVMWHLYNEGYIDITRQRYRGREVMYICKISDKAIREIHFGE